MNYLIFFLSVDNTIDTNYRIFSFRETCLFLPFSFSILTEKQQLIFKKQQLYPQSFFYERKGVVPVFILLSQKKALEEMLKV